MSQIIFGWVRKQVTVIEQILLRLLEAFRTDVGFLHPVGSDGRSHRAVDYGNALFEDLLERMFAICDHFLQAWNGGRHFIF